MKNANFLDKMSHSADIENWSLLILRLTLTIVIFPHGAQLLLGWFGGLGYTQTMNYFTTVANLPFFIGFLVIMIQFFGSLMLLFGVAVRLNALAMFVIFIGMILTSHLEHGFFMNWFGNQKGEGFEFDILFITIALILSINGSGALSIDRWLTSTTKTTSTKVQPQRNWRAA